MNHRNPRNHHGLMRAHWDARERKFRDIALMERLGAADRPGLEAEARNPNIDPTGEFDDALRLVLLARLRAD